MLGCTSATTTISIPIKASLRQVGAPGRLKNLTFFMLFFKSFLPKRELSNIFKCWPKLPIIFREIISHVEIWVCSYYTSDYSNDALAPLIDWRPGQLPGLSAPWSSLDSYVNMNWYDLILSWFVNLLTRHVTHAEASIVSSVHILYPTFFVEVKEQNSVFMLASLLLLLLCRLRPP